MAFKLFLLLYLAADVKMILKLGFPSRPTADLPNSINKVFLLHLLLGVCAFPTLHGFQICSMFAVNVFVLHFHKCVLESSSFLKLPGVTAEMFPGLCGMFVLVSHRDNQRGGGGVQLIRV